MPFSNSSAVQAALISWIDVPTMSTAQAQDIMTLGEDRIYRELRVRAMETVIGSTISAGVISVPSDYIELKTAYIDGSPIQELQRKSPDFIYTNYPTRSGGSKPKFIARQANQFIFGDYPDSTYLVYLNYYMKPATAVNGTLSGILLSAPPLWLFASLAEGEAFFGRDSRIGLWEAKYKAIKDAIQLEDERERFSGPIQMSAG